MSLLLRRSRKVEGSNKAKEPTYRTNGRHIHVQIYFGLVKNGSLGFLSWLRPCSAKGGGVRRMAKSLLSCSRLLWNAFNFRLL